MTREELKERIRSLLVMYTEGIATGVSDPEYDKLINEYGYDAYITEIKRPYMSTLQGADFVHPIGKDVLAIQPPKIKINDIKEVEVGADEFKTFKYDGSSVVAYYKDGELQNVITRGDDLVGKNQSDKLWDKVPHSVDPRVLWIQCEALCRKEDFNESCRSKANGLINSKYKLDEVDMFLHLQPFNVGTSEPMPYDKRMELAGCTDYNEFQRAGWVEGNDGTFPIDGFVIYKGTDVVPTRIYKYYGFEIVETTVKGIEWNKSPFGVYIPKLVIDEVILSGKHVNKVASGGIENLIKNEWGIGAKIRVYLSGNTIPQVHSTITKSTEFSIPNCPCCGTKMVQFSTGVHCTNVNCSEPMDMMRARIKSRTKHDEITEKDYLDTENILFALNLQRMTDSIIDTVLDMVSPPRNMEDDELYGWADEVVPYLAPTQRDEFYRLLDHYMKLRGEVKHDL